MKQLTVTLTTGQMEDLAVTWAEAKRKNGGHLLDQHKKDVVDLWLTLRAVADKHNLWCDELEDLPVWAGPIVQKALRQPPAPTLEQLLTTRFGHRVGAITLKYAQGLAKQKKPKPKVQPAKKPVQAKATPPQIPTGAAALAAAGHG